MKALVWHGGADIALEDVPEPARGAGEVVLNVALAAICGSDLHPLRGHAGPRQPPLVLGHEAVGTVDGRQGFFALFPIVACRECNACRRGLEQLCDRRGLVGLDRQGVFAEQIRVSEDALVAIPPGVPPHVAVLVEPLATVVSALRLERVTASTELLIIGCGPIGLLAIYAAQLAGAHVTAADRLPNRRALAARLGAQRVFATVDGIDEAMADVVFDAVGIQPTWQAGINAVRSGGSVVVIGLGQSSGVTPVGDLVRRGVLLRGHYAYARSDFRSALALLASAPPPLDWVSVMPIEHGAEGFRRLIEEPDTATKVVLKVR